MVVSHDTKMDVVVRCAAAADAIAPCPISNDRTHSDPYPMSEVEITTKSTGKRPIEGLQTISSRGNVSVSSTDSVGSSSDDESAAATIPMTNKKLKTSSIVSDDSSDDDDAVPTVVGSSSSDGTHREFHQEQVTNGTSAFADSPNAVSHYQKKYEPPTSNHMSKVELSLWRKQQRQQRNRMSAAASRQKQKARITELEHQIAEFQQKYAAIQTELQRIQQKSLATQIVTMSSTSEVQDVKVSRNSSSSGSSIVHPTTSVVPTSSLLSSLETVKASISKAPFKMISRQALSQELSFTPPLFFRLI